MGDTWLQLPPEMGGNRFGPFRGGLVQIGSDPGQCQIVLGAQMGIAPVHVTLAIQGPGSYLVQPVQRGFGLFLIRAGTGQLVPVPAAAPAGAGDTLVVGSPAGPRFTLFHEDNVARGAVGRGAAAAAGAGLGAGLGGAVARELWRQQQARWMMRNPVFREISHLQYRLRSGALTNPRVIISLAVGVIGLVVAGGTTCLGALGVVAQRLFD
jgi:hypothetical protein